MGLEKRKHLCNVARDPDVLFFFFFFFILLCNVQNDKVNHYGNEQGRCCVANDANPFAVQTRGTRRVDDNRQLQK